MSSRRCGPSSSTQCRRTLASAEQRHVAHGAGHGRLPRAIIPTETAELDASIEAAAEYREFRERVARDDLPRFEADFKRYLNQNTIREIAGFQTRLDAAVQADHRAHPTINTSLRDIDYNPGRFIRLDAVPTPITEIREFRTQLRACTEGALLGGVADELYSEEKFEQVRGAHRPFQGARGHRPSTTGSGRPCHRRAQLVRLQRVGAVARDRPGARDATPTPTASPAARRRSSPTRSSPPRSPTSSGSTAPGGSASDLPVRGHRRGLRTRVPTSRLASPCGSSPGSACNCSS